MLFNALVAPEGRAAVTAAMARQWNVAAVLVLIRDPELGILCPAPGFPQTLPGGPSWRTMLASCTGPRSLMGEVAFPDRHTLSPFSARVTADGAAVLLLIGGEAHGAVLPRLDDVGFPLLVALLRAEADIVDAKGFAANALAAQTQAEALTGALDATRAQLATSFACAAELNAALEALNDTLEKRVTERTLQLETEMEERQKTEELLRQSQKMEAVGQLTGGLAHDFNNLLAGITGSLELMQTRMRQGRLSDVDRYMVAAQGAAKRAAALTHRLLAFSRRQTLDPKPTDVNRLVMGLQEMIQRTVGPGIHVETVGLSGSWSALVDPSQLENALLNLCINARDAMPNGGRITIETADRRLDARTAHLHDMPEGQYLALSVTDTGVGMAPDVIARVFEPFFTTKPIGQGTGLGLSMVYGFARQSGGQVRIYSELGQGASVCIHLPRHLGAAEIAELALELADAPRAEEGQTVLVVDDEPTVRMLVTEVLEDLGYRAIEATDGVAGLQVLQSDVRIDLLVTDVGLPGGMNGRQVADAARVVRPNLKVLFITGYAENAVLSQGHLDPGMHVLTKPFALEALASRIKDLISR